MSATEVGFFVSRYLNEAPIAERSPRTTPISLNRLRNYPNPKIGNVASKAFYRHFWYFSKHLAGLSFCDLRVSFDSNWNLVKNSLAAVKRKTIKNTRRYNFCSIKSTTVFYHIKHNDTVRFISKYWSTKGSFIFNKTFLSAALSLSLSLTLAYFSSMIVLASFLIHHYINKIQKGLSAYNLPMLLEPGIKCWKILKSIKNLFKKKCRNRPKSNAIGYKTMFTFNGISSNESNSLCT